MTINYKVPLRDMEFVYYELFDGNESDFYSAKIKTARFYMLKLLPQTETLLSTLSAGSHSLMDFDDEYF